MISMSEMINFEEEIKKFHPSLEVEDVENAIYNQDRTDMADLAIKILEELEKKKQQLRAEAKF